MKFKALSVLLPWFGLVGCTSMPYSDATEPHFRVYEDFLQSAPIWESPLFKPSPSNVAAACQQPALRPEEAAALVASPDPTLISPTATPGLYAMLRQVDEYDSTMMLAPETPQDPRFAAAVASGGPAATSPLPAALANLPLTKAYVITLAASYHNSQVRRWANDPCAAQRLKAANDMLPAAQQIPVPIPTEYSLAQNGNEELSVKDIRDFGEAFLQTNLSLVKNPNTNSDTNPTALAASDPAKLTFGQLALEYFLAYYNGKFVDRNGTQPAKPSIGLTITDTTLSNVATVGMDAIYDYTVLSAARQGGDKVIKAPVVYDPQAGQTTPAGKTGQTTGKWQNPKGLQPTLAAIIQNVKVTMGADNKSATVALIGQPTSGTFTLTIESKTTTDGIAYNATAADVQTAVQKLATPNTKTATVSGPAGGPYLITFPGKPSGSVTASGSGLYLQYVVEPLAKEGLAGMTPAKLQLVQLLQGIASDGATGSNGLVMRAFGGVHIGVTAGLGLLGKLSVGDNNMLANLVEAASGVFAANSSELFASDQLYDITYPPGPPSSANNALVIGMLEFISNMNSSSPVTSNPAPSARAAVAHLAHGAQRPSVSQTGL